MKKQLSTHEQITKAYEAIEQRNGRAMPFDFDSEAYVLGVALKDEFAANVMFENFGYAESEESPFYYQDYRVLFEVMKKVFLTKQFPDIINVNKYCRDNGLSDVWDAPRLFELTQTKISSRNIGQHCRILLSLHSRRKLILETERISAQCFLPEKKLPELLDEADSAILDIRNERRANDPIRLSQIDHNDQKKFQTGFKTGIDEIDKMLHNGAGAQGGEYIIIAARPSVGKTSFAVEIASSGGVKFGDAVLFFSVEMTAEQLGGKFFENISGVPIWKLDVEKYPNASLSLDEHNGKKAYEKNQDIYQLFIDENTFINPLGIRGQIARMKRKYDIKAVFIDYLQLVRPVTNYGGSSENREISDTSFMFKAMAKEFNLPFFVLSQLNRSSDSRADKKPSLYDLRGSGSLEQDADTVIFLHDPVMAQLGNSEEERYVEAIIAKNRLGAVGTIPMTFKTTVTKFHSGGKMPEFEKPNQNGKQQKPIAVGAF